MTPDLLMRTVLGHPMTSTCCFCCGTELGTANRSREDVIPLWVQSAYALANELLTLPNGTAISYRKLKIPACKKCNNEHLSGIENVVSKAVLSGFEATKTVSLTILYQWLAKIFLGLLYKELFLPADRKNPKSNKLATGKTLENYKILWLWLHAKWGGKHHCPGSVFLYRCGIPENPKLRFDLLDDFFSGCFAIRMGEVGLIADFLENGVHKKSAWPQLRKYRQLRLAPVQFKELAVRTFYGARLLEQETFVRFFSSTKGNLSFAFFWRSTAKGNSIYREWRNEEYATLLSHYTGFDFNFVYQPPMVRTWLHDAGGHLVHMPSD